MFTGVAIAVFCATLLPAQVSAPVEELEDQLLTLNAQRKWVTARRIGEEVLGRRDNSIVAHFVIGNVYWEADADFSKAGYHLNRAEKLYERRYALDMGAHWKLHSDIVMSLVWLSSEMDRQEEQLDWIDHFNIYFKPPIVAARAWPLMELERFDESLVAIEQGLASDRHSERLRAHNSKCAVHTMMGNRVAGYEACNASLAYSRDSGDPDITVVARNGADAAAAMLYFDEAERLIDEAKTGSSFSSTNPPMYKTHLLLTQGRGGEALVEAREMLRWHMRQSPTMRSSSRALLDTVLASLFLVAGDDQRGMETINRAIRYPDRLGGTSDDPLQRKGGNALLRLTMRELARERAAERASARGLLGRLRHALVTMVPDTSWWADESMVVQACSDRQRLVRSLQYHTDTGLTVADFLKPKLVSVVGAGVVSVALEEARALETFEPVIPFFGVHEAEIAWAHGDEEQTLAIAERTLAALPEAVALIRAQLSVLAAEAAWDLDERAAAFVHYERALQLDPGSLRRRGAALPATVSVSGPARVIGAIADAVERSPRLTADPGGFRVAISGNRERFEICLRSPAGNRIRCVDGRRPAQDEGAPVPDDAYVFYAADQFHRQLFAMRIGETNLDLSSLDGSTIKNQAASEAMENLLEGL